MKRIVGITLAYIVATPVLAAYVLSVALNGAGKWIDRHTQDRPWAEWFIGRAERIAERFDV